MKNIKVGTKIEVKSSYAGEEKKETLECVGVEKGVYVFKKANRRCLIFANKEWFENKNKTWEIIGGKNAL